MSKINWSARIHFYSDDDKIKLENVPVLSYQVKGGMLRTIHLNAETKESDIVLELDDARDNNNLQIFIPPTEGIAVAQLSEAFQTKKPLWISLFVDSKVGKTWLRAFNLYSQEVVITRQPVTAQRKEGERTLKIEMSLPHPSLEEYSPKRNGEIDSRSI